MSSSLNHAGAANALEPTPEQQANLAMQGSLMALQKVVTELLALCEYRAGIVNVTREYIDTLQRTMNSDDADGSGRLFTTAIIMGAHRTIDQIDKGSA